MKSWLAAACFVLGILSAPIAEAQQLTADITDHQVNVTTGFNGANVTLFGTIEGGGDVIIVARGPKQAMVVRQRQHIAALWLNTGGFEFNSVPSYYAVLSTQPLSALLPANLREQLGIGSDTLKLDPIVKTSVEEATSYRAALLDNLHSDGQYLERIGTIDFLSAHLFRATLTLPASIPRGAYPIEVYLIRNGAIVSSQSIPLVVMDSGFEALVHRFATRSALVYGLIAVALSAMAGYAGNLLFRST